LLRLNDTKHAAGYYDRYAKRSSNVHSSSALSRGRDRQLKVPFRNFISPVFSATTEASGQCKTGKKQVAMIAQKVIDANQTHR
jgi:hypothetical protein